LADYVTGIQLSNKKKLVGGAVTILKNMSSSMGRVIPLYYGIHKIHVPVTTNQKKNILTIND